MPESKYPKRAGHHAHRFCRLLAKTAAAQEIGTEAAYLLCVIAHQEDAKRYTGAVTYYNEQLMPIAGLKTYNSFAKARTKAVAAGWLHYEPGGKRRPGRYWTTIPSEYKGLPDGASDESDGGFTSVDSTQQKGKQNRRNGDLPRSNRPKEREAIGRKKGQPSDPIPTPNPNTGSGRGPFAKVNRELLEDTDALLDWLESAAKRKRPVIGSTEFDQLNVVAAAERALAEGDNPPGLFVWIVRGKRWDVIAHEQEDRARQRLNARRRNGHTPHRLAVALGNGLADSTKVPDDE